MENKARTVSWFTAAFPAALVAVAVLDLCVVDFRSEAWSRYIGRAVLAHPGEAPESLAQLDNLFGHQMPSGNIWLEFEGFRPERPADERFMTRVYYRGNYASYPRRVYVSLPSTVVNNGQAMVQQRIVLDQLLAERLGIHWMAIFSRNEWGQISLRIRRIR